MAAGEVFVMINGEIDLSIGAVYLFTPFVFYKLNSTVGLPLVPAMIGALIVAMVIGMFNGLAVSVVGISSFVATLGTLFTLDGLTLIISHATQVTTPGTSVVNVGTFAQIFGGGPTPSCSGRSGSCSSCRLVLSFTRWGIYTVAVGGNRLGAAEAGVNTKLVLTRNFVMCAGSGRLRRHPRGRARVERPRLTRRAPTTILFQAISAAVIGGTLLQGGSGTVIGAFIGAIFLGVLQDGPEHQGRERQLLPVLPGSGGADRDGLQHLRLPRADGLRPWLTRLPARRSSPPARRRTMSCASSTSPSGFGPTVALRDINISPAQGRGPRPARATTAPASRP